MTVTFLTEYITRCYGLTFQNIESIKLQKFEDISADENNRFSVKPFEMILGKSQICDLTLMSGGLDKSLFD